MRKAPVKPKAFAKATADQTRKLNLLATGKTVLGFWVVCLFFIGAGIWESEQLVTETLFGYYLILFACFLPAGLWAYGKSHGIPVYPCFCGFQFLAFGGPLIGHHAGVFFYTPEQHLSAAWAISIALMPGTFFWFQVTKKKPVPASHYLKINLEKGDGLLLSLMLLSLFFNINLPFRLINIEWKYISLLQPVCNGLSILSAFILAYRIGSGKASRNMQFWFVFTLVSNTIIMNTSLYLSNALPSLALALGGYALGKHKIPVVSLVLVIGITYFLHAGKNEMRTKYWEIDKSVPIQNFGDVLHLYQEWTLASMNEMQRTKDEDSSSSLLERNSLLHLTLFMQERFKAGLPLMYGTTYDMIPELLIPRIIHPTKPWSLEGTTRLNIHFGLQSREDTLTTTIGWGLLNEGYANFGIWGMALVSSLLGSFLGLMGKLSSGYSIFSSRTLLAIMVLSVAIQTENTAGVFVTSIFQTAVALAVFSWAFMKKLPHEEELLFIKVPSKIKLSKSTEAAEV